MAKKSTILKTVEAIVHDEAKRKNIPTAEHQSVIKQEEKKLIRIRYPRNTDLDPQIVWKGKDEQDWSDLIVNAPPLYIQEKVHPKALIDDLLRESKKGEHDAGMITSDLFADFDGIPKELDKTEFYSHDQNWSNRMILGDSLQVMASLAEREGLRGQVQAVYFDPPYGIKFNSNFQWSTAKTKVDDGKHDQITREPEQVKAFRDTWRDGIHSYLTYIRDRLTVTRDLLTESGSIFVQIGDENSHRIRALLDEVFGPENFISEIKFRTAWTRQSKTLDSLFDTVIWFSKNSEKIKYRKFLKQNSESNSNKFDWYTTNGFDAHEIDDKEIYKQDIKKYFLRDLTSQGESSSGRFEFEYRGQKFFPRPGRSWSTRQDGLERLIKSNRLQIKGKNIFYKYYQSDYGVSEIGNVWDDTAKAGFLKQEKNIYVVQTADSVIKRCLLMSSDPGDLVLDPTCGSGTTAFVAEEIGRRWITIDTSRVALALARARIMGGRYPCYLLADSEEGRMKEFELSGTPSSTHKTTRNINHGFVYERVPHITLKSIANDASVDSIFEKWQPKLKILTNSLNKILNTNFDELDIPINCDLKWSEEAKNVYLQIVEIISNRQIEIEKSISIKAEFEYIYEKAFENKKKVRVAGPFTVESLSPHRMLNVDENDNLIDPFANDDQNSRQSFIQMILENLKTSGVQQAHKENKILFSMLTLWPGNLVCAEGKFFEGTEGETDSKRAAIFVGPEFGTVQRADLVQAAREAGDAGFDVLISCAFNYEAHATDLNNLGGIPILKARMNADLHMSEDLKNTGKGNLFVIFGEPDIDVLHGEGETISVRVNGVDVFKPQTGEVISDGADGIACWFVDTDYNEESFFVRQAYFLGANDPYSSLKITLKAEINADAWSTLKSDTSRPFPIPKSGRIAVKVINHLGDEVMKVFKVYR